MGNDGDVSAAFELKRIYLYVTRSYIAAQIRSLHGPGSNLVIFRHLVQEVIKIPLLFNCFSSFISPTFCNLLHFWSVPTASTFSDLTLIASDLQYYTIFVYFFIYPL